MALPMQPKDIKKPGPGMPGAGPTLASGSATSTPQPQVQEFSIRVPKNTKKKFHMMRFNSTLNVDFTTWKQVRMERENNAKEFKGFEEDMPKFGAGSEFGRDAREEARRKKFGFVARKYKPEDQPWILKSGGSKGKKFKGIREGGVSENAGYYVFMKGDDGIIEAYPLQEWYNFQPIQRYKALSAEEAEEEFGRRHKQQNFFSLMMRKRLRPEEDVELDDPDEAKAKRKGGGGKKSKELKISDMEEWMDSDDDSDSDEDEEKDDDKEEKAEKKKKGKKEAEAKKKKKKKDSDDEAFEESDDGDEEGREVDYISDSSVSVSDHDEKAKDEMKGVAEEDALRKLLTSDEDSEEEEKKEGEENSDAEDKKEAEEGKKDPADTKKTSSEKDKTDGTDSASNKTASTSNDKKDKGNDSMSDLSSDSEPEGSKKKDAKKDSKESNSGNSSRSASPALQPDGKRKATSDALAAVAAKKAKLDNFASASASPYLAGASEAGITEDAVRRYLMRKPMTTTELLQKFKSKKTGLSSDQLVNIMTQILKKINPVKQTIKGKMYLSIKAQGAPKPAESS
ncbi:General transcription factor IIF subunit 1 [Frankliniella fusca]|uniref:Transcription initiation factor IIF subunit alpha n=1 Tax=Frankliniella fusca TaxID=407009 RepID=A0AAE1HD06_9NEOP|nr:General transcription factor IIF subunit 1 [Frankliniella fusca]